MTQMLLFDATSTDTTATPFGTVAPVVAAQSVAKTFATDLGAADQAGDQAAALNGNEPGLHAMGDLARLVLLRYDLMAARRVK